jgi:three-Cys-motif partner protein
MEPKGTLWPLDPHTRGKHLVLKAYLDAWFPILGRWNGRIIFIDGFAGPGEYEKGEPGSPLIALQTLRDHRAKHLISAEVGFWFIENDARRADHLRALIAGLQGDLPPSCKTEVECGPFDEKMTAALDDLDAQKKKLAPAFVMIDPFGVSGTPMTVVKRILANPKSEVYVSFMYDFISRFRDTPEFAPHLDDLFGCKDWRGGVALTDPHERKDFFYSLYETQLREAGASQVVRFELYEGSRLVYAIFFGTNSTKGADRMKEAIWKVVPFGDFAFRGTRSTQLGLDLTQADMRPLRTAIREHFKAGEWLGVETVAEFVASDRTDYYTGQLKRGALIPMEDDHEIDVDPGTRKKRRTFPPGTRFRLR